MNTLLEKVLKCVKDHRSVPRKPAVLPISSLAEMDDFENIDEDRYTDVVSEKSLVNINEQLHININVIIPHLTM